MGRPDEEVSNPNCFQIFGVDIMIDDNLRAWLIEINSFPSLTFTAERNVKPNMVGGKLSGNEGGYDHYAGALKGRGGYREKPEKVTQELDKYLKPRMVAEAIHIALGKKELDPEASEFKFDLKGMNLTEEEMLDNEVWGEPRFIQVLPKQHNEEFSAMNNARKVFERLCGYRVTETINVVQFQRLAILNGLPSLVDKGKLIQSRMHMKSHLEKVYKAVLKMLNPKSQVTHMNFEAFLEAIDTIASKVDTTEVRQSVRFKNLVEGIVRNF
jgi:hypothetical protein